MEVEHEVVDVKINSGPVLKRQDILLEKKSREASPCRENEKAWGSTSVSQCEEDTGSLSYYAPVS